MVKTKTILVVDDEPHVVNIVKFLLEKKYRIIEAYSGLDAIEKAKKYHPDLITMDIMMPNMDGFEAADKIKSDPETKDIPLLMISAKGRMRDKIEGIEVGAEDYITKPFDPMELEEKITAVLAE